MKSNYGLLKVHWKTKQTPGSKSLKTNKFLMVNYSKNQIIPLNIAAEFSE